MEKISTGNTIPEELLVQQAGMRPQFIAPHSEFLRPLSAQPEVSGNSRRWGDATLRVQRAAVNSLLEEAAGLGMPRDLTALMLATARVESGFNPDAAAGSSSAGGLGQFIDATARAYGLDHGKKFSLSDAARALSRHTMDNYKRAMRLCAGKTRGCVLEHTYALHHDGPGLKHGGLELARSRVLPWAKRFESWLGSAQTAP